MVKMIFNLTIDLGTLSHLAFPDWTDLAFIYYFEGSEWASEALATPIDLSVASKLMSWVTELMFDVM